MAVKSCLENPLLLWKARSCRSSISQGTEGLWERGAGVGLGPSEPKQKSCCWGQQIWSCSAGVAPKHP